MGLERRLGACCSSKRTHVLFAAHSRQLLTVHNLGYRRSNVLFWPLWTPDVHVYTDAHVGKPSTYIRPLRWIGVNYLLTGLMT